MDRRNLLRSLFALGGAATVLALPRSSEAASLFNELENMDGQTFVSDADLPAEGAQDAQWGPGVRCRTRIDRFGRRVRVCTRPAPFRPRPRPRPRRCWWRVDRFGRRVRVCR